MSFLSCSSLLFSDCVIKLLAHVESLSDEQSVQHVLNRMLEDAVAQVQPFAIVSPTMTLICFVLVRVLNVVFLVVREKRLQMMMRRNSRIS